MLVLLWSLWSFSVGLMTLSQPPVSCSRLQNRPQQPRIHQGQCSRWWVRCGNLLLFGSPYPLRKKEKEQKCYCRSAVSKLDGRAFDNPASWGKKLTTMSSKKGEKSGRGWLWIVCNKFCFPIYILAILRYSR